MGDLTTRGFFLLLLVVAYWLGSCQWDSRGDGSATERLTAELQDLEPRIQQDCTQCHLWTRPEILPRDVWRSKIDKMYEIANEQLLVAERKPIKIPSRDVNGYFVSLAPDNLETPPWGPREGGPPVQYEARSLQGPDGGNAQPGVSNVRLLEVFEDVDGSELIVCDMLWRWVGWVPNVSGGAGIEKLGTAVHPARAEAVDLDQDGRTDLLVAELGSPTPTDDRVGGVAWLRRTGKRDFQYVRLASDLGRVADARAADFDGDGDLDIVVAEFGWIEEGSILYLENRSERKMSPRFLPRMLDGRNGAIHVPIVDLNGDGRPDFVALFSQENESVVAFLNRGAGEFESRELFAAPHPHWGYTGLEPVDLDGDGDLDFLLTNGDTLDDEVWFKPYQGIAWLENKGSLVFEHHFVDVYYGAHRAEATDLDGDGDLDIVASSFLPRIEEGDRAQMQIPGVVWYEQVTPGLFRGYPLADRSCDHATLEVGDIDRDGQADIIAGVMRLTPSGHRAAGSVRLWLSRPSSSAAHEAHFPRHARQH